MRMYLKDAAYLAVCNLAVVVVVSFGFELVPKSMAVVEMWTAHRCQDVVTGDTFTCGE